MCRSLSGGNAPLENRETGKQKPSLAKIGRAKREQVPETCVGPVFTLFALFTLFSLFVVFHYSRGAPLQF